MVVTYFNLAEPDNERLLADAPNEKHEIVRCPKGHLAVYRRIDDLALEVKHTKREERIIWKWISGCVFQESILAEFERDGIAGYRLRPASVKFKDGPVSYEYRELIVTG